MATTRKTTNIQKGMNPDRRRATARRAEKMKGDLKKRRQTAFNPQTIKANSPKAVSAAKKRKAK